ncbi:MAG: Holliday junction resolvase RuvX [Defluviitaleaceae bacterium]|nr:Holliday junction resolvase RuvX [Defluviitaleaceae bacterium]
MRMLGLDYGDKRIGVAISDGLGWTAAPLTTIDRKNPVDLKSSIEAIQKIINENQVKRVILGYPKNMDGSEGENCQKVQDFKSKLFKALYGIDIILYDERLSSSRAIQIYNEIGINSKKIRQGGIDKMAAQVILQGYLDMQSNQANTYKGEKGMNDNNLNELEMDDEVEIETIVMTDEDGNDVEYMIIDEFDHGGTTFLVMINAVEVENDEVEAVIFKQVESTDEEFIYEEISEDEYNMLEPVLQQRLDDFDIDMK